MMRNDSKDMGSCNVN